MTPEQLEEIQGIGPKTVEKISIAVNNYFSSLEAGSSGCTGTAGAAPAEGEAAAGGRSAGSWKPARKRSPTKPIAKSAAGSRLPRLGPQTRRKRSGRGRPGRSKQPG